MRPLGASRARDALGTVGLSLLIFCLCPVAATSLDEAEAAGRRFYRAGESSLPAQAVLPGPGLRIPSRDLPCAGCHGEEGGGRREGGLRAPDITFTSLSAVYNGVRPTGRAHPPYTTALLARAIRNGLDPAGNALAPEMPHYELSDEDLANLIAYLEILGRDAAPGVTDTEIRVGLLRPESGALGEIGQDVEALLGVYFQDWTQRGGVFGRQLRLVVEDFDPAQPGSALAAARRLGDDEPVFCFLGNVGVKPDGEASRWIASRDIPVIAPVGILPDAAFGPVERVFHLYPTVADQARALVDYALGALKREPNRISIVYSQDATGERGAQAARKALERSGATQKLERAYPPGRFPAAEMAVSLHDAGSTSVILLGSGKDAWNLLEEAQQLGWRPDLLGTARLFGARIFSLPAKLAEQITIAAPIPQLDLGSPATRRFLRLTDAHGLAPRHRAFQMGSFAGATVLEEGLRRSGRTLSRARLVHQLERIHELDTGVAHPVSFDENQHVGARGAQIVRLDPKTQRFRAVGPWQEPRPLDHP